MKKKLLTKQVITIGIFCLAAGVGAETARAGLMNGDFGDGFNGWSAATYDGTQSTFDPTGDTRYNVNPAENSATIAMADWDWMNFLYQEFTIGAGAEVLIFDYLWAPSDMIADSVQAVLWFDENDDGEYDDLNDSFVDLFQGATNAEVLGNPSVSFDISAYQGMSVKLEFGVIDGDWVMTDTFTVSNIKIIPEPGTALLMGIGLAGLAGVRRKRKN